MHPLLQLARHASAFFFFVFCVCRCILIKSSFFKQVLHLMNKMNLPAPFRMALPTPPLPSQVPVTPHPQPIPQSTTTGEHHSADLSSDESELESSDVLATSVFPV